MTLGAILVIITFRTQMPHLLHRVSAQTLQEERAAALHVVELAELENPAAVKDFGQVPPRVDCLDTCLVVKGLCHPAFVSTLPTSTDS